MPNYNTPNAFMYNAIFSAGVLIGSENLQDDLLHIKVGDIPTESTDDVSIDEYISKECQTASFLILASCDVTMSENRRLFVCRLKYLDTNREPQFRTLQVWIEPVSGAAGGITIIPLTPAQEEKVRKLLDF